MTMTISFGWWLLPAAVTVASYLWAWLTTRGSRPSFGDAVVALIYYGAATIASLIAWLIWAVLV